MDTTEAEDVKHTRFDSDSEVEALSDGECPDSPPAKRRNRTPSPVIVNADIKKGNETDYGDFFIDRTESIDIGEEEGDSQLSAESTDSTSDWMKNLSSSLLSSDIDLTSPQVEKPKRNKPACFNCDGDHNLAQCKEPRNLRKIREGQQAMREKQRARLDNGRYHEPPGGSADQKFRPGKLSSSLRQALGIGPDDIPEWIYRMRRMGFVQGYPPGYLKRAVGRDTSMKMLKFHAINIDDELATNAEEEVEVEQPAPIIDSEKMIYFLGFNQTYRNLRDREGNFRVPPFRDFVDFHQQEIVKKHEDEQRDRKRIREREKKEARRRSKKLADDEDIIILAPPPPPILDNEDDCMIIDKPDTAYMDISIAEASSEQPTAPPATPKGSSKAIAVGTPVMTRKSTTGEELAQQHAPALDAFTKGIVPFTAQEEPTPHRGFMKRIVAKIKEVTGK